jgi:hypothetical protein
MGLPEMAELVKKGGRKGDTILAHINPSEAALLRKHGGSGKTNPVTGLPEFEGGFSDESDFMPGGSQAEPVQQVEDNRPATSENPIPTPSGGIGGAIGTSELGQPAPPPAGIGEPVQQMPGYTPAVPVIAPTPPELQLGAPKTPEGTPVTPPEGGFLDKTRALAQGLGTTPMGLARLGLTGVGAIQGLDASKRAQEQAGRNEAEIRTQAQPFRDQGQQLVSLGQAGKLTPAQQQSIDAMRAQQAQQLAQMGQSGGGTASQQAEANIQRMTQQFAQQNIDEGMKLIGIADQYVQNAIKAGYQGSIDAQNASSRFYQSLAGGLGGNIGQQQVSGTEK